MRRLSILLVTLAIGLGLMFTLNAVTSAQSPSPPTPVPAATPVNAPATALTIVGRITNETPGGTLPITTTVMLLGYDGQKPALRTAAVADAAGNVRFEGVKNAPGRSFVLAATVGRTFYGGQPQISEAGARELALALKTYGTTTDVSRIRVAKMYVLGEFLSSTELQVVNVYILSNGDGRAVEGGEQAPDGRKATLRFSLPREATEVKFHGQDAAGFIRTDDGFLTIWGIPPGEQVGRVTVSYSLPYTGQLHLESQVHYPVQEVQALLVDQGVTVASSQLKDAGSAQRQDGVAMRSYTGGAIAAGQALALDLSGTPQLTPVGAATIVPEVVTASQASQGLVLDPRQRIALAVVAVGLILLAAGGIWWAWSRRRAKSWGDGSLSSEHRALVQALASLDEAHDSGFISDTDYGLQRPILKAALLRAFENPLHPLT